MTATRRELIESIQAANELLIRRARTTFKTFVRYTKDDYDMQWFHFVICERLQAFVEGKIKKMMILMPPQHGKSELASRLLPAFMLGLNPDLRIAVTSYSDSIASGFNRSIQRYIDTEPYAKLFPNTKLNGSKIFRTNYDNFIRTDHKFEVVAKKGSLKSVGRGGSLTSEPVDIGIIDDLFKDRAEAKSMTISQSAWEWYVDVFKTRLHNDSQQLIMNTRWADNDLVGRLIEEEPGEWEIIKLPAIRTADVVSYDTRTEGDVLWPGRHSLENILGQKKLSQATFNSLYQQDPKPNTEILIFPNWICIPDWTPTSAISWGLDFGKTTGINALVRSFMPDEKTVDFDECCYAANMPVSAIVDCLRDNGYKEGELIWCDHQPAKIQELRLAGIAAFPATKGPGSIDAGIQYLKKFTCRYTQRSTNLKFELNNYQWVTYGKIITNVPVDEDNHLLDASRYARFSRYVRGG
jgi:hypothetical protein